MSHSYTALYYHIIFGTKGRKPLIKEDIRSRLYDYIGGIAKGESGTILAAGGTDDHVHLLARLHPSTAPAEIMRRIKANASKWIHGTWPEMKHFAWQEGYGAFTVSRSSLDDVSSYIQRQEAHHARTTFEEEFIAFLKRHGVEYDERYLWR